MANYLLKASSPSCYFITLRRQNVGHVVRKQTDTRVWVARLFDITEYGTSAVDAFTRAVNARNRAPRPSVDNPH